MAKLNTGIYKITNTVNGKCYIGSALNLSSRFREHKSNLRLNKHDNRYLQFAFNKYGREVFKYEVLLFCSKADLLFYEQRAIDCFKSAGRSGYNLHPTAKNSLGFKHSEEARVNHRKAARERVASPETKAKMSRTFFKKGQIPWNKGKTGVLSPEALQKMSEKMMGRVPANKGTHHTEEAKAKMSRAMKLRMQSEAEREKLRTALTGYKHTEEAKQNMASAHIEAWKSEERREKHRVSLTGKPSRMKGKKHSEETKIKMSESQKKIYASSDERRLIQGINSKKVWDKFKQENPTGPLRKVAL